MSASRHPRRRAALIVLATIAALVGIRAQVSRGARAPRADRGLVVRTAHYVNRVDAASTTRLPSGEIALRTNRGVDVRIERALLVQQSASLVDCLGVGGDAWKERAAALRRFVALEGTAFAGHGQGLDPSASAAPRVIDLLAPGDTEFGKTEFPEARYCRAHFVFLGALGADPTASGARGPADVALARLSLYAKGAFRASPPAERESDATTVWTPFEWRTTEADALLLDLPALVDGSLDGHEAEVVVERKLARYFDDVDFARTGADSSRVNAGLLLRNANHDARVRVHTHG